MPHGRGVPRGWTALTRATTLHALPLLKTDIFALRHGRTCALERRQGRIQPEDAISDHHDDAGAKSR